MDCARSANDSVLEDNQGSDTRRGSGIVLLNLVGQCGPILGTRLYPSSEEPRFVKGMSVCAAFMFFTTLLAFSLRTLLVWENRRLDQKHGTVAEQKAALTAAAAAPATAGDGNAEKDYAKGDTTSSGAGESAIGSENYGPMYRYVL